jgi:hypothetical protein
VTVVHSDFYSFVPAGGAWSAGHETVDGILALDSFSGRPMTTQEARGHALRAFRPGVRFDGVVYHPSLTKSEVPTSSDRAAAYLLIDVFEPGGLWSRRNDVKLFSKPGAFAGDSGGDCGSGGILCTVNAANAPWGWNDGDDGEVQRGDIAVDPTRLVTHYFASPEGVSREYTYNPYLLRNEPRISTPLVARAAASPRAGRFSQGETALAEGGPGLSTRSALRRP